MRQLIDALLNAKRVLIMCHVNPDGDTLGSAAALSIALNSIDKETYICVSDGVPAKYAFLKEYAEYYTPDMLPEAEFDCAVSVDVASAERMGVFREIYDKCPVRINIDHHMTNDLYGQHNLVENRPASAEVIYKVISEMGIKLSKSMGECLYLAICTDTGRFAYLGTDKNTFEVAGAIAETGADIPKICTLVFSSRPVRGTKLLAKTLNSLEMYCSGKVSLISTSLEDIAAAGALSEDTEDFINFAREIDSCEIAVYIREVAEGEYKISLRSKLYADVAEVATNFGGGGHKRAAGCSIKGEYDTVKRLVLRAVEKAL